MLLIMAAALAEGYRGALFLQGDHFQVSASVPLEQEKTIVEDLITEAVAAGYFNIDVDTSTLVDLSKPAVPEQQTVNATLSAQLAAHVRKIQPQGVRFPSAAIAKGDMFHGGRVTRLHE
jgi:hypothetical protein